MRRVAAALLAFCLVFLGGCSWIDTIRDQSSETEQQNRYVAEYEDCWAYCFLSDEQKANYGAVYTALRDGFATEETVTLERSGEKRRGLAVRLPNPASDAKEIQRLYLAVTQDHPAFFYLDNDYGYSGVGSRYDTLILSYMMSADERAAARERLYQKREEYLSRIQPTMTDFEKELVLHDALLTQCQYHHEAAAETQSERFSTAFTVYGALVEGRAVCEGYARALQYLLNDAGVQATVVAGYDRQGTPHMWNAVALGGKLYYVDPTWDDTEQGIEYTYFNVNSRDMTASHCEGSETIGVFSTTETEYNYYRMTGSYFEVADQKQIALHVASALTAGEKTVHLRFSADCFDDALFFVQQSMWFTETVNACLPVGVAPLETYRFTYDENYNTVTICKKTS